MPACNNTAAIYRHITPVKEPDWSQPSRCTSPSTHSQSFQYPCRTSSTCLSIEVGKMAVNEPPGFWNSLHPVGQIRGSHLAPGSVESQHCWESARDHYRYVWTSSSILLVPQLSGDSGLHGIISYSFSRTIW